MNISVSIREINGPGGEKTFYADALDHETSQHLGIASEELATTLIYLASAILDLQLQRKPGIIPDNPMPPPTKEALEKSKIATLGFVQVAPKDT